MKHVRHRGGLIGLFLLAILAKGLIAQHRFGDEFGGKFQGFTVSPNEHIMNEFEGLPEVRAVRGRVVDPTGAALPGAILELRSENPYDRVRGVLVKEDGSFRMRFVPDGIYVFKVTLQSFQSVYGKLRVSRKAPKGKTLEFELKFGV